ncbi:amino acid adenylation domain-containing protein, partial [Rhodococcus sp. O3]|uniref:amino acid adenylation domain-containing protein n=1 Tax=Rhodococcus sp. O3 TaxID=3404919 RepID=UPI003B67DE01
MSVRKPGQESLTIEDLPRLISEVAAVAPERVALSHGDTAVTYGTLHDELTGLDAVMGGALGPDALVPVVLSNLVPALLESDADGGLAGVVETLICDTGDVVDVPVVAKAADTLPALFEQQVARTPDAIALEFEGETLTYAQFDAAANRMARYLVSIGVGPETTVGLAIRRSLDLLVAMYGIAKAGGAYVPLDPDHPADRIAHVLAAARPVAVLTTSRDGIEVPAHVPLHEVDRLDLTGFDAAPLTDADRTGPLRPDNTAYIIFTSGSTGLPKGVAVAHRAIVANLRWRQREYGFTEADVILQKTPFTFDVSVWEFFWPLQVGARLVVAVPDGHRDPEYLARTIADRGVTALHFVPSMLSVFVAEPLAARTDSLRYVFASGEALPAQTVARFHEISSAELHNLYGPTEAAVDVTYYATARGDRTIPIGAAVDDTGLHVLDDALRPVPPGVPGELYLSGVQLARGYVARPDLTSDRFVADPTGRNGERMYRTGDLVRRRPDGQLDYIGRVDFQVKLRGLRVELGEIEAAILGRDDVSQAVVVVHSDPVTGDHLVAYVVATGGVTLDTAELTATARERLPDYMVPNLFVQLDEFPLNASGKLDRKALPAPDFTSAREYREPSTPAEQAVAQIFADLLGAERVGADDDFFELGGNSLIATRAVARINSRFSVHVEVGEFFDAPTVADLARLVDEAADRGTGPRLPLRPMPRPDRVPLSLAQQRMWFLNQLEPDSAVNNIPFALRLSGLLDRHALQIAVADVLARHEVLRTVYPEVDGVGYQKVVPTREVIPDLSPVAVSESEVAERIAEKMAAPFDVTQRVPFWAGLFEISATEHVLAFSVHHIAGDGFSMGPLTRDVMTAYAARSAGESPDWQPLTVQYADYSIWQREMLGSEDDPESVAARQIDFWKRELADLPDELPLPTDRPRPAVATSHGDLLRFSLDASLRNRLNAVARDNNATLFMVVHSALAVLLSRLSGSRDIAIGSPVAGRGDVALDDLIGMFVNPLVLRSTVDPAEHFTELLSRVRASDLKAFAHAEVPFERLVEVLNPVRSQSRHPLFQVALAFQNMDNTRLELPGLTVSGVEFDYDLAKFDLQVTVADHPDGADNGLLVEMSYATDLFDPATVESIAARFVRVLEAIAADPAAVVGDIELLDAAERDALVAGVDATRHDIDASTTLPALFEARAADNPGAVAVVSGGQSLTYGEFASRVNRLARRLIAQGVGPEVRVALAMRRSADLVMAMYAVLTAGGAYVPVDPDQPDDRIDYILETAAPLCVLVADAADAERFGDRTVLVAGDDDPAVSDAPVADADRRSVLRPDNTAYVLFTSGSTGRPKGVSVAQRSVVNQVLWLTDRFGIDSSDVVLLKTPVTFDVSVWELFCTLLAGARMVIAEPDGHRDPVYLAQLIDEQSVTMVSFVPSMLGPFVSVLGSGDGASLRAVLVAGEAFPPSTAAQVHAAIPGAALHNLYGPTEFTVHATEAAVRPDAAVTIGRPVWNSGALVLDSRLRPVPFGVAGELYLSGVQLARGYHGRVDLTADRFVADPYGAPGERMYRTGDLVRWTRTAGGAPELVYIGRTDFQVKFRGQRIELGEIEAVLSADPSVLSAVVLVHESSTGQHLVAYVVPVPGAVIDAGAARTAAAAALPSYMVPSVVTVLDAFPLNASGKLDRKALPEPEFEAREFRAPTTPVEEIVAGVFGEVLGVERVGLDDDFFALGGNSLIATQVVSRLGAALDTRVQVRTLFEASTVVDLAARLESHVGAGGRAALTAQVRPERVPLSLAQSRMWFLNRFDPDSTAYNLPMALRIRGALDVDALRAAVADVVARHESLRTVYPETSDGPVQVVLPVQQSVPDVDVERTTAEQLLAAVTDFMVRPFDVTSEVPLRIRLFDLGGDEFVLAMVVHHISADGASMAPFVRDVMLAYSARVGGGAPSWEPPAVQYADYALWQRSVLGSEDDPSSLISQQLAYWRGALAGLPDQLELPADRPRPAVQSVAGARVDVAVPAELHGRLVQLARAHNATLFMVVHAALSVLLARLSGTSDVAVGTPIAGRGERELDDLIGMFVNTLVLRADVRSGGSFEELLGAVR